MSSKTFQKRRKFIDIIKTINFNKPGPVEIAREAGISLSTYYRWLKDEEILNMVGKENAIDLKERCPDILGILIKSALNGDMRAVKIFFDRYDEFIESDNEEEVLTADRIIEIVQNAKKREMKENEKKVGQNEN